MAISTVSVGAAPATTYISSGDSAVTFMSLCNTSGAAVACEIHVVPDGAVAGPGNLLITDLEIIAGDTYILYQGGEKLVLENNDSIVVLSSVASVVSVITSYVTV